MGTLLHQQLILASATIKVAHGEEEEADQVPQKAGASTIPRGLVCNTGAQAASHLDYIQVRLFTTDGLHKADAPSPQRVPALQHYCQAAFHLDLF